MRFGYVPAPYEPATWAAARALLDRAVIRGGNDWSEVEELLADGRAQLWLAVTDQPIAAMVTRMDGTVFEAWLAGGAVLSGCVPFLETAFKAGREAGATSARLTGRKGWERVLRPYGWRRDGDDLVKDQA